MILDAQTNVKFPLPKSNLKTELYLDLQPPFSILLFFSFLGLLPSSLLRLVDDCVQVRVEEEKVVILSAVLLSETLLMEVLEEIIYGFDRCQVSLWFSLLRAPEASFPSPQLNLEQV